MDAQETIPSRLCCKILSYHLVFAATYSHAPTTNCRACLRSRCTGHDDALDAHVTLHSTLSLAPFSCCNTNLCSYNLKSHCRIVLRSMYAAACSAATGATCRGETRSYFLVPFVCAATVLRQLQQCCDSCNINSRDAMQLSLAHALAPFRPLSVDMCGCIILTKYDRDIPQF